MPQDIYSKAGADAATSAAINALGLGTAATTDATDFEAAGAAAALAATLGTAATTDASAYATAAQGAKAEGAVQQLGAVSLAAIGNSIEEGGTSEATLVRKPLSYVVATAMRSAGRLRLVRVAGVSNDTTAQMLARFDTDITPHAPTLVLLGSAENDLKSPTPNLTPAQAVAGVAALVGKCRQIGATPILRTTVPRGAVVTHARIAEFNWRLMRYAQEEGLVCLDFYGLLASETDGTLYATAGYTSDGTHPTNAGAAAIADYILSHPGIAPFLTPGATSVSRSNNDPLNLVTNGLLITDTNADGVPDGWTAQTTAGVTNSLVTVTGVPGKMFQMNRASGASRITFSTAVSAGFTPGDRLALSYRLQADGATAAYNGVYGIFAGSTGLASFKSHDTGTGALPDGVGYLEFVVPAGTTAITLYVASDPGVGVVRVGQVTLRNLTTSGLV